MFNVRTFARMAGVLAAAAVLALSLSAGTAFGWTDCRDEGVTEGPTVNLPPCPGNNEGEQPAEGEQPGEGEQPAEEQPPVIAPAISESAPAPQPISTGLLPAAPLPAAAVAPAPSTPVVKGAIGTRGEGKTGSTEAPVTLAATSTTTQPVASEGKLASTGLDILPLTILGLLALGGSAFFFRRAQRC